MQSTSRNSFFGFSSVQSLNHVRIFATPWTVVHQASLSIMKLLEFAQLMSIESLMPFNLLILCHPLLLPSVVLSTRMFSNESVLCISWPRCWSFSFSITPSNEYSGLIYLGLTGLISLQSKELSIILFNITVQKHQFFGAQLSL